MAIRSAAKAVIINDDCILLNRCRREDNRIYYDLPGGGQNQYEPLEQTVVREVLEETGYSVRVVRLVALAEEIYTDAELRRQYPDYTHRVMHIFAAQLLDAPRAVPGELDMGMERCIWMPLKEASELTELYPSGLNENLKHIADGGAPLWLGTSMRDWHTA